MPLVSVLMLVKTVRLHLQSPSSTALLIKASSLPLISCSKAESRSQVNIFTRSAAERQHKAKIDSTAIKRAIAVRGSILDYDTGDKVQRKLRMLARSKFDSHRALLFLEILLHRSLKKTALLTRVMTEIKVGDSDGGRRKQHEGRL